MKKASIELKNKIVINFIYNLNIKKKEHLLNKLVIRSEKDILPVTKMVTSEDLIESIFARHEAPLPSKISISSPSFFLKTLTK